MMRPAARAARTATFNMGCMGRRLK